MPRSGPQHTIPANMARAARNAGHWLRLPASSSKALASTKPSPSISSSRLFQLSCSLPTVASWQPLLVLHPAPPPMLLPATEVAWMVVVLRHMAAALVDMWAWLGEPGGVPGAESASQASSLLERRAPVLAPLRLMLLQLLPDMRGARLWRLLGPLVWVILIACGYGRHRNGDQSICMWAVACRQRVVCLLLRC